MGDARAAIADLIFRYADLIDAGDYQGLGALFEHGALVGHDGALLARGSDQVADQYRRSTRIHPETGTPRTHHVTSNLSIEVDEQAGTAACRSRYTVFQATEALPLQPIVAGRYRDRFQRSGAAWRFAERRFFVDLVGDVSQHLLFELEAGRREP